MSDPYKRDQRKGRWMVDADLLRDYRHFEINKLIQSQALICETEYHLQRNVMEFMGISEHFDVVPEVNLIPLYRPVIITERGAIDLRYTVRWERVDEN